MGENVVAEALSAVALAAGRHVVHRGQADPWYGAAEADTHVFSYQKDFAALWGIDGSGAGLRTVAEEFARKKGKQRTDIVVVWDGIPVGNTPPIDTTRYLTPIDWAVALSLSIAKFVSRKSGGAGQESCPDLHILIMDLASQNVANALGVRFVGEYPNRGVMSMPWIRLFRPVVENGGEWDAVNLVKNLVGNPNDKNTFATMREDVGSAESNLDPISRVWSSFLTKPAEADDHHALANLIGPLLLLSDSHRDDKNVQALRCLMQAIGILPEEDSGAGGTVAAAANGLHGDGRPWVERNDMPPGKLKVLLIDDQWRCGWGEVVCKALGASYTPSSGGAEMNEPFLQIGKVDDNVEIKATDSVDWLVDKLAALDSMDQRFSLTLDGGNGDMEAQEILLLDLRLFSGKSIEDEARFVKRLLEIAKKNPDAEYPSRLPYPGFSKEEIEGIDAWTGEAIDSDSGRSEIRDDSRYRRALTLLPRILALTDLSCPIVLFSSTGRRDIIAPLQEISSIVTDFEKPRIETALIADNDNIDRSRTGFVRAFKRARQILDARALIHRLKAAVKTEAGAACVLTSKKGKEIYAEVYLDESGSEVRQGSLTPDSGREMTVGGILALFKNDDEAERFDKSLRCHDTAKTVLKESTEVMRQEQEEQERIRQERGQKREWRTKEEKRRWEEQRKKAKDIFRNNINNTGILEEVVKLAEDSGIELSFVALRGSPGDAVLREGGRVLSEEVADNLWLEMMANVIELAIYHYLSLRFPRCDVSYGVYMPTRVRAVVGKVTDAEKQTHSQLGLSVPDSFPEIKSSYFTLVNQKDANLLVKRIASNYSDASFKPRSTSAQVLMLSGAFDPDLEDCRVLHLIADTLVSKWHSDLLSTSGHVGSNNDGLDEWPLHKGFSGKYGEVLQGVLSANRLALNGNVGRAMAKVAHIKAEDLAGTEPRDIVRGLCSSLLRFANQMTGQDWGVLLGEMEKLSGNDSICAGVEVRQGERRSTP